HHRLALRGLTLSAALSTALLTEKATQAALPAGLTAAIVHAGLRYAAGHVPTAVGGLEPALSLARGLLKAMFLNKVKIAAVWLLGGCLLAAGAGMAAHWRAIAEKGPQPAAANKGKDQAPTNSQASTDHDSDRLARKLRVVVLDPQGKPLSGAH